MNRKNAYRQREGLKSNEGFHADATSMNVGSDGVPALTLASLSNFA